MRTAVIFATLAASSPAFAGGFGVFGHFGLHNEDVYYYSSTAADGSEISSPANYRQFQQTQIIPTTGGGLEFILGDRDDKITGVFRGYYSVDFPQSDPRDGTIDVNSESVVEAHREEMYHVGMASMGLNWNMVGNPDGVQAGFSAHLGSGFLTGDHGEFFQGMIGPTVNARLNRQTFLFADLQGFVRWKKEASFGGQLVAGARFMFD